jgi:dihydrofolate reductase
MPKPIHLIAAVDNKWGLGKNNDLAWHLPPDMKHFKELTTKTYFKDKLNAVIMGRKTWESIPQKYRPLPGRKNIILSKTLSQAPESTELYQSLEEAVKALNTQDDVEKIFIIGGSKLYNQALQDLIPDKLYITFLYKDFDCDVFLEEPPEQYKLIDQTRRQIYNEVEYQFAEFHKN